MNYIAEINAFNEWCEQHYLPMGSQFLWYKLMAKNNRLGWCEWMSVDNYELMGILRTKREATAIDIRDKLLDAGLIEYVKGKKGVPNKYKMISLSILKANTVTNTVVESVVNTVVESVVNTVDINKQNINETKLNEEPKSLLHGAETAPCSNTVIQLTLNDKSEYPIIEEQVHKWADLYPAVDVIQQLRNMRGWLEANPTKRKTKNGILRFINSWLSKEQNQGGNKNKSMNGEMHSYGINSGRNSTNGFNGQSNAYGGDETSAKLDAAILKQNSRWEED